MIELVRRRMMMGGSAKPYDAEVEWVELNGKGFSIRQTPSQYTVWFKIMVITRDNSNEYPSYIGGTGKWSGVAGRNRWLFYFSKHENQWHMESYYHDITYKDSAIINKIYETQYPLYVESQNAIIFIGEARCKMRFYELRAYTLQGEPWLHLKMVRKGNKAFFYDDVSSTMYNIQCDYIIGPDKTV